MFFYKEVFSGITPVSKTTHFILTIRCDSHLIIQDLIVSSWKSKLITCVIQAYKIEELESSLASACVLYLY